MKIAQISPLFESVPPKLYGGTERVVHYLTEELVHQGHDVTLFASGDSVTNAKLVKAHPRALRLNKSILDPIAPHMTMIEMVERAATDFDIIHSHIDYFYYPVMHRSKRKNYITTLHGRLDIEELFLMYKEYADIPLISISDSQRIPLPFANWKKTIHHGLPLDLFHLNNKPQDYLAFVGRISSEKRVDRAIEVAINSDIPIRIAAKIDKADEEYYETNIKHLFEHPLVDYIGEINDNEKQELLGNALGLLFLIDWPEPFGLVMIEAMACGTPVIAYPKGSIPEIIEHGVNGFIVNSQDEALEAVKKLPSLSRKKCRQVFEERFSAPRMATDYVAIYKSILNDPKGDLMPHHQNGQIGINDARKKRIYGSKAAK